MTGRRKRRRWHQRQGQPRGRTIRNQTDDPTEGISVQATQAVEHWHVSKLIAFRLVFIYTILYCLDAVFIWLQPIGIFDRIEPLYVSLWQTLITWVSCVIFDSAKSATYHGWVFADDLFGWLRVGCILVMTIAGTVLWSVLDRQRKNYLALQEWLRLLLRLVLAEALFSYGIAKILLTQFRPMSLITLLTPYGEQSPMDVLWRFMSYSPGYSIFAGLAEIVPALLLLVPRLATTAALIAIPVLVNVFVLNVCYDVRVKLYSFHLLLIAVILLTPDAVRLVSFLLNRNVGKRSVPRLFSNQWCNTLSPYVVCALALCLFAHATKIHLRAAQSDTRRSAFYGIWQVDEETVNGKPCVPGTSERWEKLVFDRPNNMFIVRSGSQFNEMFVQISDDLKTMSVGQCDWNTSDSASNRSVRWLVRSDLSVKKIDDGRMTISGKYCGTSLEASLHRIDETKMPLLRQKFRWITNPEDYNLFGR